MTEERKFAILFAATILSARKLLEMDADKPSMAKQFFVDRAIEDAAFIFCELTPHIDRVSAPAYGGLGSSRQREGPMNHSHAYPSWSPIYVSAVLETDSQKLPQRIQEAHQAIEGRLSQAPQPDAAEQKALTDARDAIATLKSVAFLKKERPTGSA